jgi:hypothetical protein
MQGGNPLVTQSVKFATHPMDGKTFKLFATGAVTIYYMFNIICLSYTDCAKQTPNDAIDAK